MDWFSGFLRKYAFRESTFRLQFSNPLTGESFTSPPDPANLRSEQLLPLIEYYDIEQRGILTEDGYKDVLFLKQKRTAENPEPEDAIFVGEIFGFPTRESFISRFLEWFHRIRVLKILQNSLPENGYGSKCNIVRLLDWGVCKRLRGSEVVTPEPGYALGVSVFENYWQSGNRYLTMQLMIESAGESNIFSDWNVFSGIVGQVLCTVLLYQQKFGLIHQKLTPNSICLFELGDSPKRMLYSIQDSLSKRDFSFTSRFLAKITDFEMAVLGKMEVYPPYEAKRSRAESLNFDQDLFQFCAYTFEGLLQYVNRSNFRTIHQRIWNFFALTLVRYTQNWSSQYLWEDIQNHAIDTTVLIESFLDNVRQGEWDDDLAQKLRKEMIEHRYETVPSSFGGGMIMRTLLAPFEEFIVYEINETPYLHISYSTRPAKEFSFPERIKGSDARLIQLDSGEPQKIRIVEKQTKNLLCEHVLSLQQLSTIYLKARIACPHCGKN